MDEERYLGLGERGRWLWDTVIESHSVQPTDLPALYGLCRWYQIWSDADAKIQETKGEKNQYLMTCSAGVAWKNVLGLAARFGLTPKDRVLVRPHKSDTADGSLKRFIA